MDFTIEFQDDTAARPFDVEITLSGAPSLADLWKLRDRLENDRHFRAGLAMLVDVSDLLPSSVAEVDLAQLGGRIVAGDWNAAPRAVAIIAPDPELYKAARAYRAHLGGSRSNRHVVSSRTEAIAWLKEQRDHL